MFRIIITVFIGFTCISASAQLSKVEKKIVSSIDNKKADALRLLEEVVNVNSGTMNVDGVYKVGQIFKSRFEALGMDTRWVDGKEFNRSGHLIATQKGKGKTLLLIGHLDTVFELSSPFQKFSMVNDTTMSGPGVGDMKGGDVIIVQSLQALHEAGVLKDMNIIVVMTGDEELSGRPLARSKYDLIEAAKAADIALGFEDGDGKIHTAEISRRSASGWKLTVSGLPAHSSQIFTEKIGAGAIYEASRILNQFYENLSAEKDLTFNPGVILGGTAVDYNADQSGGTAYGKTNVVSKDVVVAGDLRAVSPEQLERAHQIMEKIVSQNRPQTKASILFDEGYPPLAPTQGNIDLMKKFEQVSLDLGYGKMTPVNPRFAGAADISFTSGLVDMAMDGLGPASAGGHTVNETADPRSISIQAKRAAVLMYRLTKNQDK